MKASETNLQEIIEGTKQYVIPIFQRTYSWQMKQWSQLWEDIVELVADEHDSHFIGSIVSIPIDANTHGIQQFSVIDGQQRLTTIFILLAAVRDVVKENDLEELAAEIHNTLLINQYKKGRDMYKFLPTQADREDFEKVINGGVSEGLGQSNIIKAYQYFYGKIKDYQEELNVSELKNKITGNLSIVSIVLSPNDNPYLVFESLNAKGQPLTQADLIRNYLFMKISPDEQEEQYERYWLPMQEELGNQLTEFIRHYLVGNNENVRKSDVYVKFKEESEARERREKTEAVSLLENLSQFASYYGKLLNPSLENNLVIQKDLQRMNRFDVKIAYPFLLYVYRDYKSGKYDEKQFSRIIHIVENYLVRRFVCNIDTKSLNKIFSAAYKQIKELDAEHSIEQIAGYLQNRSYPKDPEFVESLKTNNFYGSNDRRRRGFYILEAIEKSYSHKESVDLSKMTVEHIMPQTLTDEWLEELGEKGEATHEDHLNNLGNLTLTGYNSELSNNLFAEKRKQYEKSNLQLNRDLALFEKWDEESIMERVNALSQKVKELWPYFGSEEYEITKIKGTSPRLFIIKGESYDVKTWRELSEVLVMHIYDEHPESYQKELVNRPKWLSESKAGMRVAKKLKNGHYLEVNFNAETIYNYCVDLLKEAGYNEKDWQIEIDKK